MHLTIKKSVKVKSKIGKSATLNLDQQQCQLNQQLKHENTMSFSKLNV